MDCSTIDVALHLLIEPVFKVEDISSLYLAILFSYLLEVNRDTIMLPVVTRVKRLIFGPSQILPEA